MKKITLVSSLMILSISSTAQAGFWGSKKKDTPVCRDALVTILGESAENTKLDFKKTLTGVDANGKVCTYDIAVNELKADKKGTVNVTGEGFWPFTNTIAIENGKNCKADAQEVSGYAYNENRDGINRYYPRDLKIQKLSASGKLKLTYKQTGAAKECTGELN